MEHKGTKELQTERLILRPWKEFEAYENDTNTVNERRLSPVGYLPL